MLLSLSVIVIVILSSFFPVSKWVELRRGKEGEKKTKNANQCGRINVYYRIDPAVSRSEIKGFSKEEKQKERREKEEKEEKEETTPLRPTGAAGDGERERERERRRRRREKKKKKRERGGTRRQQNKWFKGF